MAIVVREVYHHNLVTEFNLIQQSLSRFPFASLDTEFPGTVYYPDGVPAHLRSTLSPAAFYKVMKKNIDSLNLIQIGLTLSDANGHLPTFGTPSQYVWEFNFRDFDYEFDLQNPDSISLLRRQGIDFLKNKRIGIDSRHFAMLFDASGLGLSSFCGRVMWVTFHGPYDFGFLIKILTRRALPEDVYDVKNMIRLFGLHGGLDRVAKSLNLGRLAGKSHQAGSDSLLTMHVFLTLIKRCSNDEKMESAMGKLNHMVYGLTRVS
ncbi:probable ccr4-associated factor 1 homolog 11 [Phtheirospermum japonicum]|uniref:poly(A)-specific ribonuclease n=1 Tax=Phtheirospermum japonicum TaxID=374723 RepID=A0A830BG39_9LAMI|nr:probable ccr4-associated factor 1 homolog 11 [Phtheirospermum japonicum]